MARRKSYERSESQGLLTAEPLFIPDHYDIERAKAASKRRDERISAAAKQRRIWLKDPNIDEIEKEKIIHIAESKRIGAFKRRTSGLFVPLNGTERKAIVDMPIVKAETEKAYGEERVYEKYKDQDVSTKKVDLWAHFSGQRAHKDIRQKYRTYRDKSAVNAARIALEVGNKGGEITRESFDYDPEYRIDPNSHSPNQRILAYNSVLKYFMALEAFAVLDTSVLGKEGTVKWPRYDHRHDLQNRMDRAHGQLEGLADDVFADRVDEAYWSHFSRERFWVDAIKQHDGFLEQNRQYRREQLGFNQSPDPPPMDVYINNAWLPSKPQ